MALTYSSAEIRRVAPIPNPERGPNKTVIGWAGPLNQRGACGVGNLLDFRHYKLSDYGAGQAASMESGFSKESLHKSSGGCGFLSAAFIDDEICKATYLKLKEWYPILYQSPIRFNVNSGNNFFFCIFDTGEKPMPERYSDPDHQDYEEDHEPGFPNGLEW